MNYVPSGHQQQGILLPAPLGRGLAPMAIGADNSGLFEDPPVLKEGALIAFIRLHPFFSSVCIRIYYPIYYTIIFTKVKKNVLIYKENKGMPIFAYFEGF